MSNDPGQTATRQFLAQALGQRCPGCRRPLQQHRYAVIGLTVASDTTRERWSALIADYRREAWAQVAEYAEFEGALNAFEVIAIDCPRGDCSALVYRDPAEFDDPHLVLEQRALAADSWSQLVATVEPTKWNTF